MPRSPFSSLPSSPASSPSYGPADSSPPSSPGLSHSQLSADFDSPPRSPALVHPFAGSSKATKKVRLYEKQESRWGAEMNDDAPAEDEDGTSTKFGDCDASMTACANSDSEFDAFFGETDTEDAALEEQELWDKTISEAIDDGNGLIDLRCVSHDLRRRVASSLSPAPQVLEEVSRQFRHQLPTWKTLLFCPASGSHHVSLPPLHPLHCPPQSHCRHAS